MTFATVEIASSAQAEGGAELPAAAAAADRNQTVRELVRASGLPPAVALTIFNRSLTAAAACSESQWKGFMAEPGSARFLPMNAQQLSHAIDQFARIGVHREAA